MLNAAAVIREILDGLDCTADTEDDEEKVFKIPLVESRGEDEEESAFARAGNHDNCCPMSLKSNAHDKSVRQHNGDSLEFVRMLSLLHNMMCW